MSITLRPKFFESNQTFLRTVESQVKRQLISPANTARRGGMILNFSKYDLLVWFGSILPASNAEWLVIPRGANCDIPLLFTGEIHGFWLGDDSKTAKIYELYGD